MKPSEIVSTLTELLSEKNRVKLLYHYTTVDKAIKILTSGRLLFSPQSRMNDLYEANRMLSSPGHSSAPDYCLFEEEYKKYKQISLVCDNLSINKSYLRGFNILPMWAHYADSGNGVCFVLSRNAIIKRCRKKNAIPKAVRYSPEYHPSIDFHSDNPQEEILKRMDAWFFKKAKEWEYEQEYRIMKKNENKEQCQGLKTSRAIKAIIYARLGSSGQEVPENTPNYNVINIMANRMHIPLLRYWIPNSFVDYSSLTIETEGDRELVWKSI